MNRKLRLQLTYARRRNTSTRQAQEIGPAAGATAAIPHLRNRGSPPPLQLPGRCCGVPASNRATPVARPWEGAATVGPSGRYWYDGSVRMQTGTVRFPEGLAYPYRWKCTQSVPKEPQTVGEHIIRTGHFSHLCIFLAIACQPNRYKGYTAFICYQVKSRKLRKSTPGLQLRVTTFSGAILREFVGVQK